MSDAPLCYGDVGLRDVLNDDLEGEEMAEFRGFFIHPDHEGRYHVQYDGHAGIVMKFHHEDYDDPLALASDLVDCLIRFNDFDYRDDKEGLVEWAGKFITSDKERAEERPDLYLHVPERE